MKTITKNTKRVLSLVIALALLLGSMLISNVGVNIKADAAEATTLTWSGNADTTFASGSGTQADPYIIETPEQFAFLMKHSQNAWDGSAHTTATTGKFYKVAPNLIFDMNGKSWSAYNGTNFAGTFDGNGLIVKNLTGSAARMGLFPSVEGPATIKNVTVENCNFSSAATGSGGIGGIFGAHNNWLRTGDVTVENCAVINCTIKNTSSNDSSRAGLIGGAQNYGPVVIKNCYTANNTISAVDTSLANCGFLPSRGGSASLTVTNSIAIGNSPYPNVSGHGTFTNVYTDTANSVYTGTGIATVATGANALSTMGLGSAYWMATAGAPVLKGAHKFNAVNNGNGTHTATCTCCSPAVAGLAEDHFYDLGNAEGGMAYCSCGAAIAFTSKIWDGTADSNWDGAGTKDDPYIIRTAEQLYAMVQSEGYKTEGGKDIPLYFKVADGIDTFYLNDAINYNTAEKFAGATGLMTNWSKDLVTDLTCTDPNCPSKSGNNTAGRDLHYGGYIYTFLGHFDGNGVTIKGLYSKTDANNTATSFYPGTGFFPGMSDNASIANVTFDVSYIENKGGNAAVVTSSFGTASSDSYYYSSSARCSSFTTRYAEHNDANGLVGASITLSNIVVKNAYLTTTYKNQWTVNQNVGGLLATQFSADAVDISNCLFDATGSVMTVKDSSTPLKAGIFASSTYINNGNSLYNCVTLSNDNIDNIASGYSTQYNISINCYAKGTGTAEHGTNWTNDITTAGMPLLNWATWDKDTITPSASSDGFTFKEYKYYRNNFKNTETYLGNPTGSYSDGVNDAGMFFKFNTLEGSGTEADPYLISDADTLFQVVAAGGMNRGNPQHFKLTNDIDIGGTQWVKYQDQSEDDIRPGENATKTIVYYAYRNFGGVLDGDGYAITGLYSASADATAGFIPTLDGGTVKNLHFRGGYVYSSASGAKTGIIAGEVTGGGTIQNCSIAETASTAIADNNDNAGTNCINFTTNPVTVDENTDANVYYGIVGQDAQLVSRGQKLPCVDIDADGKGDEYTARDLTALRNKILRKADYKLVMGDADRSGSVNIRDLVFVKRNIAQDEFGAQDGFWSAVKGGSIAIYFSDNDDYDAARKVELFLESQVPGLDVVKYGVGTTMVGVTTTTTVPSENAIVITSNNSSADWSINYNPETAVLNISGKNYTAAYEAAEYFAANSNASTGALVKDYTGKQDTNKTPITVNGQTYYYAWADEFNTPVNDSVSYDTWYIRDKGGDTEIRNSYGRKNQSYAFYDNLKLGSDEMLPMLNEVKDGKLYMHRGVEGYTAWETAYGSNNLASYASNTTLTTGDKVMFDSNDMASGGILQTKNSFLYNKGYVEFKAKLPNDKHSFPALWLYSTPGYSNRDISLSLYSKVLPLNSRYDNSSMNFVANKVESYKYEVPTYFFELDVVEILNQGEVRKRVDTTIHKWYNNARVAGSGNEFTIYDLDWNAVRNNNNQFSSVVASYNGSSYTSGSISLNSGSKTSSSAFSSSTYEGGIQMNYTNRSLIGENAQTKELIFGYLWENDTMIMYIMNGDESSSDYRTVLKSWNLNSTLTGGDRTYKGYDGYNGAAVGDDQYAHILIDNHMFPYKAVSALSQFFGNGDFTSEEVKNDGILELDYVRVYQLDGAKNIITSDTEAFNANNRLGK